MATKKKVPNKSAAIRALLKVNPKAEPLAIIAALKKQGLKCDSSLVYSVRKSALGKKKRKPGPKPSGKGSAARIAAGQKAAATREENNRKAAAEQAAKSVNASQLREAKNFAAGIGGVGQAIEALKQLESLQV